jgi:hypothetical protein
MLWEVKTSKNSFKLEKIVVKEDILRKVKDSSKINKVWLILTIIKTLFINLNLNLISQNTPHRSIY